MNWRRVSQIVLGCFVALLLLAPVYESFDHWDGFPRSGNDTALNLVGAVAFCGLVVVAAKSVPWLLSAVLSAFSTGRLFQFQTSSLSRVNCTAIGESPPPLHLSPLRI